MVGEPYITYGVSPLFCGLWPASGQGDSCGGEGAFGCSFSSDVGQATNAERKALATMGRRGGKKAAERWETDPEGEYAQGRRAVMEKTHRKKRVQGQTSRAKIQALIGQAYVETRKLPTRKEIMAETGFSEATVKRHVRSLRQEGLLPQ